MLQLTETAILHMDSPTTLSSQLTQVAIQGWIVSQLPIHKIALSHHNHQLQQIERPDVVAAYPNYRYVQGFIDIVPTTWLSEQNLSLTITLGQQNIEQNFLLAPSSSEDIVIQRQFLKSVNNQLYNLDGIQQRTLLQATPSTINIEVTNRCNLSCPTCARNYWDNDKNQIGDIDLSLVEKLRPYLERANMISLLGYGEAVLSPNFKQVIGFIKQFNARIAMFNNGTTLSLKIADILLESGVDGLIISLDGATEATIEHTRTASLKTIIRNVDQLRQRSQERNLPLPRLSISFTASRLNIAELPDLVDLAHEHGFTEIFVGIPKIFKTSLIPESLFLDQEHASQQFEQAIQRGKELGVFVQIPNFNQTQGCHQPFELLMVKWNGSVRLCCSTAIEAALPLYVETGNLYDIPLESLWNSEIAQRTRAGLLGLEKPHPVCARCPYLKSTFENFIRLL